MESYIKLLSIIAIVCICADASGTGTTVVHRDVESTTRRSLREDIHSSTVGIKRNIENGTTRVARDVSLNVTKRSVPHVHRQFLLTTAKPNISTSQSVHARGVETTRISRDLNVTKRENGFNHTVNVRAVETTRVSRDVSTSHIIHARGVETTRISRTLNVTKRENGFNHTVNVRAVETTRSSRDVSTSHIINARGVETTRVSRDVNTTKKAAHKKEKVTTTKPNKVKLSVDNVVTNFTNAKVRSINDSSIVKRDDSFSSTRVAIARDASFTVTKRELFGGDLNVTKRGIETTSTRIRRAVVEPNRDQTRLLFSDDNNNGGGDDDTDDNGDE